MAAAESQALPHNATVADWGAFAVQVLIAVSFEVGDDLGRGLFAQHGTAQGIANARDVVSVEVAHGLWVEPGWQMLFLQTWHLFGLTVGWLVIAHLMDYVYVLGHVFVTLGVAVWVFVFRRRYFVVMRNVVMLTNAFALVVYEHFPVAPPRLTTGLSWHGHPYVFQDTVFGVLAGGRMVSQALTYNEFSAMPSVHMAWAAIASATVIWLARPVAVKIVAALYPAAMLVAVVVTGNHFILDVVAALPVVALAAAVSFGVAHFPGSSRWPGWVREHIAGAG